MLAQLLHPEPQYSYWRSTHAFFCLNITVYQVYPSPPIIPETSLDHYSNILPTGLGLHVLRCRLCYLMRLDQDLYSLRCHINLYSRLHNIHGFYPTVLQLTLGSYSESGVRKHHSLCFPVPRSREHSSLHMIIPQFSFVQCLRALHHS
jgi:hypothetical protein